jgi:transcriptional regulator with XRE-family HTH domain
VSATTPLGAEVRRLRIALGCRQDTLARNAGMSCDSLSRIERGATARPHFEAIHALAAVLGVAPAHLLALRDTAGPVPVPVNSTSVSIGPRLRDARRAARLTQRALSYASDVPLRTIQGLEQGRHRSAHYRTLAALAHSLRVPISDLDPQRLT